MSYEQLIFIRNIIVVVGVVLVIALIVALIYLSPFAQKRRIKRKGGAYYEVDSETLHRHMLEEGRKRIAAQEAIIAAQKARRLSYNATLPPEERAAAELEDAKSDAMNEYLENLATGGVTDTQPDATKSIVKGAVVGGIIAGPAGAVVGAMVGKEKAKK
jgi:uncharacterized membrane protein